MPKGCSQKKKQKGRVPATTVEANAPLPPPQYTESPCLYLATMLIELENLIPPNPASGGLHKHGSPKRVKTWFDHYRKMPDGASMVLVTVDVAVTGVEWLNQAITSGKVTHFLRQELIKIQRDALAKGDLASAEAVITMLAFL